MLVVLNVTGCADMQQRTGMNDKQMGAATGAALGCVGGAVLARLTGGDAGVGCAAGAVVGVGPCGR